MLSYPAEWLLDLFNGGRTDSGIRVSELTALQVIEFLSGVDFIAGKIASLPFHVYERSISPANGRAHHTISYAHDYYDMIHTEPNIEMSRQTALKAFVAHCLVWGNGYQEIQRDAGNAAVALWPRNPGKTRPRRMLQTVTIPAQPWRPFPVTINRGEMAFETTDWMDEHELEDLSKQGQNYRRLIPAEDMIHVPGLALDGRMGQAPVWLARQTLGLGLSTEKFGAKYFANFARPGGLLELPAMQKADRDQARNSWMEAQGGENSHRIAVMPAGTKWTNVSYNPEQSQTLQTRQHIRTQVAALLHLPARVLGDTSRTSKGSTEQENQEILDYAMGPWINAIKLEYKRKLFPHPNVGRRPKSPFYVDFDTSGMVRADAKDREAFNASGKQWGYLSTNDVRALEGLNPIDETWADDYWMPVNMTLTTTPINPNLQDGKGLGTADTSTPAPKPKRKPPSEKGEADDD